MLKTGQTLKKTCERIEEIQKLVAKGYTAKEIATAMNVSKTTVYSYAKRLVIDLPVSRHVTRQIDYSATFTPWCLNCTADDCVWDEMHKCQWQKQYEHKQRKSGKT